MTEAAASQEEELAVVRNSLRQTGAAWTFHGKTVENTLRDLAVKFGFTVSDLAQGFTRIEVGTKNTSKSFDLLNLAMDVSRARHLDLATASTALTRAAQGNDLAVRRLGIVIPRTTANVTALKREHDLATASGVKFNKQQQFAYQTALAQAKALDVQANKVGIVAEIQKRFGGQSTAFANTAKGAFQSFHEAFNEFEVSLGRALIPTLTEAALGLAKFFKATADGQTVAHAAAAAATSLGNAFHTVEDIAKQLAPTLGLVARPLTKIAEFAGFGGILGLIAAFKGVSLTLGLAEAAQRKYQQALALGRGEQASLATSTTRGIAAYNADTAAVERNSLALTQNAIAAERAALAQRVSGAAAGLQGIGTAAGAVGAGALASATESAAAAEKVKEGFVASSEAVVGFTADSAVLADVTRHTAKDLGQYERSVLGVEKGITKASTAGALYGRAQTAEAERQVATAGATAKSAAAYDSLAGSVDASSASLNANAASSARSAAALESGTVATIARVNTAYRTLGPAGAQGAAGVGQLETAAHGASAGLLGTTNAVASTAHHTQGLHQSFVNAGKGAKAASTEVTGLAAAQGRYAGAVQAGVGPQAAATAATGREAEAYAGLAVTTDRAAAAQVHFTTASVGAAAASSAATVAQAGVGLERLSAAQLAVGSSTRAIGPAGTVATTSLKTLGGEIEKTAVRTAGLRATFKSLGRGLFEMAGGVRSLAIVGFGALAFAVFKLATQETDLEKTTKKLQETLGSLASDFGTVTNAAKTYADAISAAKTDKIARDEAAVAVARARQALATLDAKKGTGEYAQALLNLRRANDEYRLAIGRVTADEGAAAGARKAHAAGIISLERDKQEALDLTVKALDEAQKPSHRAGFIHIGILHNFALLQGFKNSIAEAPSAAKANDIFADSLHKIIESLKEAHPFFAQQLQDIDLLVRAGSIPDKKRTIDIIVKTGSARAAVQGLIVDLGKLPGGLAHVNAGLSQYAQVLRNTDPELARKIALLRLFQTVVGKTASPKEVNLILHTKDFKGAIAAAVSEFAKLKGTGGKAGAEAAQQFALRFAVMLKQAGLVKTLKEGLGLVITESGKVLAGISAATLTNARVSRDAARTSLRDQRSLVESARQSARDAGRQVADAQRSLADAIRSSAQSIRDAVISANQNLAGIGQSLNDSVDQFLDAQKKTDALIGPSAKQFKELKKQLAEGASGTDLARSARALTNQIDEQQVVEGNAADKRKERSRRSIDDTIAQFRTGAISLATFNKRIAATLAADGITYKKAGKSLGIAFAEGFRGQVRGLAQQALAIQQGPHVKGGAGFEPSIVKPLEAVRDAQRQIGDAQRNLADSVRAQAKADKALSDAQKKLPGLIAQAAKVETKLENLEGRQAKFLDQQADDIAKAQKLYHDQLRSVGQVSAIFGFGGGKEVGKALGDGTKKGLQQAEAGVVQAIEALITSILGAGRKKAKAKSPSEETRNLGHDLGLGLAQGIRGSKPLVEGAAQDIASAAIRGMRQADDLFAQHAKHSVKVKVEDDFKKASRPLDGERGTPAAIEGRPHDRVMLAEALSHKRILTSQERHLGNLVEESRRQTALLHHPKPIPKPRRSGAAISGARLAARAD